MGTPTVNKSLLGAPFTHDEITGALSAEFESVHSYFSDIPQTLFFTAPPNVWSPAENLDHLIRACKPVALGLGLPKFTLRLRFGRPSHPSRTLHEVRRTYVEDALSNGGVASGPYLPDVPTNSAGRLKLLTTWQALAPPFIRNLSRWTESDLDRHQVVHPLLGNMTAREILFFTLYHNMHHVNDVQRLLGQPEVEWFTP